LGTAGNDEADDEAGDHLDSSHDTLHVRL